MITLIMVYNIPLIITKQTFFNSVCSTAFKKRVLYDIVGYN